MTLWVDAIIPSVYVHKRSTHWVFGNKTPKEAFIGVEPDINHMRIFGCSVYIHISKEKISKIEHSGKNRTFVGYSETSKAYYIYIPI